MKLYKSVYKGSVEGEEEDNRELLLVSAIKRSNLDEGSYTLIWDEDYNNFSIYKIGTECPVDIKVEVTCQHCFEPIESLVEVYDKSQYTAITALDACGNIDYGKEAVDKGPYNIKWICPNCQKVITTDKQELKKILRKIYKVTHP